MKASLHVPKKKFKKQNVGLTFFTIYFESLNDNLDIEQQMKTVSQQTNSVSL